MLGLLSKSVLEQSALTRRMTANLSVSIRTHVGLSFELQHPICVPSGRILMKNQELISRLSQILTPKDCQDLRQSFGVCV
jgi:hypothetical protein